MGFGEGRVLYTIDRLETSPEKSLFILEEPETSLHENAQYEFAKYLLDVCNRRHHQIILSTHSSVILKALPSSARKLIVRDEGGVNIRNGISADQVRSVLSGGHAGQLVICVEDVFARVLLTEVIRIKNREMLKAVAIHDIGDKNAVREAVCLLRRIGTKAIAVRDADVGAAPQDGLLSFPGKLPPEVEVFNNAAVKQMITEKYGVDIDWILARDDIKDHHKIAHHIAADAKVDEEVVRAFAIETYVKEISSEFNDLISDIREALI
jgi:energy-coupling factor transporter ATP-binding protein EcfA2